MIFITHQMVFYKARAGGRRVGQAVNAQQAQLQQPLPFNMAPQALQTQLATNQQAQQATMNNAPLANAIFANNAYGQQFQGNQQGAPADLAAYESASGDNVLLADQNVSNVHVDVARGDNGGEMVLATLPNGVQASVTIPAAQAAPAPQCEFPTQSVGLERQVTITNTPPQLQNIETDVCGNVIGYTETMTRNLAAGPWVPTSGLQGSVENFTDVNGVLESSQFGGNVHLANSKGYANMVPQPTVVQGPLVGGRRRAGAAYSNANRAYGVSQLGKFRSK